MSELVTSNSLKDFFRTLLLDAFSHRDVTVAETTEFYLVNLLSEFATADRLFTQNSEGRRDHEPLAILYHRAQQQDRDGQIKTLRQIGDVSLYKVGFFGDSVRGGAVGPDYYIQMGGSAYGQIANLTPTSGWAVVYRELQSKFRALVEVLEEIAARGLCSTGPSGALRVYESWVRTGSERLERVLVDAGMVVPGAKKGGFSN
jgi:hypothetical protein